MEHNCRIVVKEISPISAEKLELAKNRIWRVASSRHKALSHLKDKLLAAKTTYSIDFIKKGGLLYEQY